MCGCSDCGSYEMWIDHTIDFAGPHGNSKLLPGLMFARAEFRKLHAPASTSRSFVPGIQNMRGNGLEEEDVQRVLALAIR